MMLVRRDASDRFFSNLFVHVRQLDKHRVTGFPTGTHKVDAFELCLNFNVQGTNNRALCRPEKDAELAS
jgi:hypothetical protein